MKAKVKLTEEYSGCSINLVCEVENIAMVGQADEYVYRPEYLSDSQRKKIENYFGKEQAYHTKAEVIKLIPTADDIYHQIQEEGGFNNWRNWSASEVTEWVMANYNCSKGLAEKVAYMIK